LRALSHQFARVGAWFGSRKVGAAVGVFLLPVLKQSLGLSITLLIVAISSLLGLAVTAFLGVETKGRSLA
jgi:UPF0716 family protein affecting phage T7 exclusion